MLTEQECHCPVGNLPRTLESRSHRQLQLHRKISLVLLRYKALRDNACKHENTYYGDTEEREHPS